MPIEDRYQIEAEIGRGQSGVVYRARERASGRPVAVKVFRRDEADGPQDGERQRLEREAALLARVRHPGVIRIVEAAASGPSACLVTELVEGESLQARLQRETRLGVQQTLSIVSQAARALAAAHGQGVVHRDVKPANLLLTADGTLKITDFGVAGETGRPGRGSRRYFLGTPAYVAPEQWLGRPLDGRADLYSLGVVLYRCLTGRLPHEGASVREIVHRALSRPPRPPSELIPTLPATIDDICLRALSREPEQRFHDGAAMAEALERTAAPDAGHASLTAGAIDLEDALEQTSPQRRPGGRAGRDALRAAALAVAVLGAALIVQQGLPSGSDGAAGSRAEAKPRDRSLRPPPPPVDRSALRRFADAAWPTAAVREPGPAEDPEPDRSASGSELLAVPDPDAELVARYARRAMPPTRQPAPAEPPARPNPRPAPARELREEPPPRASSAKAPVDAARPARAAVLVRHSLEEGLLEVRVDGRRRALRRIGAAGGAALPGEPVSALLELEPGEREIELNLLSATSRVDVSARWRSRWKRGGFAAREWRLVQRDGGWSLIEGGSR